jgi:hypothetical protein
MVLASSSTWSKASGAGRRSRYVRLIYRMTDGRLWVVDIPVTAAVSALIRQRAMDRAAARYHTITGRTCPPTALVAVMGDFKKYLDKKSERA